MVGVRLRPGVAFILSGIAAQAMLGRRMRLRDIAAFHDLVSAEPSLRTPEQCIDVLQQFLIRRLDDAKVHGVVANLYMQEIERRRGCVRVAELAARCGVSPRHLTRLMRLWVGYGPKLLRDRREVSRDAEGDGALAKPIWRGSGVRDGLFASRPT